LCGLRLSRSMNRDQIRGRHGKNRIKAHIFDGLARVQAAFLEFVCPRLLNGGAAPQPRSIDHGRRTLWGWSAANRIFRLKPVSFREEIAAYLTGKTEPEQFIEKKGNHRWTPMNTDPSGLCDSSK